MGGDGALAALMAVSLISSVSSRSILGFQKLAAAAVSSNTSKESPGLSPPASQLHNNPSDDQPKISKGLDSPGGSYHKIPSVSASVILPDGKKRVNEKDATKKIEDNTSKIIGKEETCNGKPNNCRDSGSLSACILGPAAGNNDLQVLVENKGDTDLKVNLGFLTKVSNDKREIDVFKHQIEKINVSSVPGKGVKLVLSAGHGDCTLLIGPLVHPAKNYFSYLPAIDKLLTPINGAYLSILMVMVLAGFFACWKCRKMRQGKVRYQQLEMGAQGEAPGAMTVGSVDGWDEGWDDNWDEENAVQSPASWHTGSISAHRLTSRATNKDGWENDWDD